MKQIRNLIIGKTIMRRLLICFLVSTLFPTILITVILCLRFDHNYRSMAKSQTMISQNLIKAYINSYQDEIDTITAAPYYHSYFSSRKSLDPNVSDYQAKLNEFQTEMQGLINLTTYSSSDIQDLIIYSDGQLLFFPKIYNEYRYFRNNLELENQSWYSHALEGDGKTVYTPTRETKESENDLLDVSHFYVSRKIRNLRQPEQISLILLNFRSKSLEEHLLNIDLLYDSFAVITNEKQELIYTGHPLTEEAFEKIFSGEQFRYEGSLWNSLLDQDKDQALNVHIVYSLDEISRHTRSLICSSLGIYLIGILVALVLFYSFNRWIVNSTAALQGTFDQLEGGNLNARCPEVAVEEFNDIGSSLNDVIVKLDEKIKNEYILTIQQKSLQLSALQSQIQPHFLINTIYCFIALNQIGETKKLNDGFYSLAHLLRYVLNKEHFTTIGAECGFIEDYLKLQQLRFSERLTFEIKCPDEFRSIQIPRLILQPLVENAVIHGIEPCEHPCFCKIIVSKKDNMLYVLVEDNGVGFRTDEISAESSPNGNTEPAGAHASVGIPYVRDRLRLWHPDAVLNISCDETTKVEIQIPWSALIDENTDR
ncbi:MAG: histidine kinase [Anaerolineaceae bacterium]|nr:histidine kinase [Anaerolineaceae bacterium]